jgi:hypothetical protein
MGTDELTFRDIAAHLPTPPTFVPAADLWPRIAAAYNARRQRRRMQRVGAAVAIMVIAVALVVLPVASPKTAASIDWQARAQALEIELNALARLHANGESAVAFDVEAELANVDGALQSAYDRGAQKEELAQLWKKRSAILSVLLAARQQQLTLTRI